MHKSVGCQCCWHGKAYNLMPAGIQTQPSSDTTTIVIGVLLALVACFAFLFGVLALCYIV